MTTLNDKLLIVGGATPSNKIVNKVIFLDNGHWKDYSEMPTCRYYSTAAGYQSLLIVLGEAIWIEGESK